MDKIALKQLYIDEHTRQRLHHAKTLLDHPVRPVKFLFERMEPGSPYSTRSAQEVFHEAIRKAGIHKKQTFHTLRHSFVTHLLEKGVDVKYHISRPLNYFFKDSGINSNSTIDTVIL